MYQTFAFLMVEATGFCPWAEFPRTDRITEEINCRFRMLVTRTHGNTWFRFYPSTQTKNTVQPCGYTVFLVEATGFEPTTFASRTQRATNCATPRFSVFLNIVYSHGNANIIPNTFPLVKPFFSNIASLSRIILSVYPIFPCFSHSVPLLFFISTLTCPRHFEKTRLFYNHVFITFKQLFFNNRRVAIFQTSEQLRCAARFMEFHRHVFQTHRQRFVRIRHRQGSLFRIGKAHVFKGN